MPKFIPGLKLSEKFYQKAVKPILDHEVPGLVYSAALIGWGSEVLGYDTPLSRDHHWGPRVLLFLSEKGHPKHNERISKTLADQLPYEFRGYSTNFGKPEQNGVRQPVKITSGPVDHMVMIFTIRSFFELRLGFDPTGKISVTDWLACPQQRLLEMTRGAVFHDGLGLEKLRQKLCFYPTDVWLYMLAAQWKKISEEEAFVGRAGDTGDELGSQIVAARIVRELMRLCFLMERQYAPYSKWLGTAFGKLAIAKKLSPIMRRVLSAKAWRQREKALSEAYAVVAKKHNKLAITAPLPEKTSSYFERPYQVIHADRISSAIAAQINDPAVKKIVPLIGSVDQFTDSTDIVSDPGLWRSLTRIY